jgi:hypothetical protein
VVYLHDVIDTAGLDKRDAAKLSARVREIVAAPVDAYYMVGSNGDGKRVPATREAGR